MMKIYIHENSSQHKHRKLTLKISFPANGMFRDILQGENCKGKSVIPGPTKFNKPYGENIRPY